MERTKKIVENVSKQYETFRKRQVKNRKKTFRCPCCNIKAYTEMELRKHFNTNKHRRNQQRGMVKH